MYVVVVVVVVVVVYFMLSRHFQKVNSPNILLKTKRKRFPTTPDKQWHSSENILLRSKNLYATDPIGCLNILE